MEEEAVKEKVEKEEVVVIEEQIAGCEGDCTSRSGGGEERGDGRCACENLICIKPYGNSSMVDFYSSVTWAVCACVCPFCGSSLGRV